MRVHLQRNSCGPGGSSHFLGFISLCGGDGVGRSQLLATTSTDFQETVAGLWQAHFNIEMCVSFHHVYT